MKNLTITRCDNGWYRVQGPHCRYTVKPMASDWNSGPGWLIVQHVPGSNFGTTAGGARLLNEALDTVALLEGVK